MYDSLLLYSIGRWTAQVTSSSPLRHLWHNEHNTTVFLWLSYTWREIYTGIHWLRCNFQHMFIRRRYQSAFWQGYSQHRGLYRWSVAQRPFSSRQGVRLPTLGLATRVVHFMQIHVNYTCPRQDRAIVTPPTFLSQVSTTCTSGVYVYGWVEQGTSTWVEVSVQTGERQMIID